MNAQNIAGNSNSTVFSGFHGICCVASTATRLNIISLTPRNSYHILLFTINNWVNNEIRPNKFRPNKSRMYSIVYEANMRLAMNGILIWMKRITNYVNCKGKRTTHSSISISLNQTWNDVQLLFFIFKSNINIVLCLFKSLSLKNNLLKCCHYSPSQCMTMTAIAIMHYNQQQGQIGKINKSRQWLFNAHKHKRIHWYLFGEKWSNQWPDTGPAVRRSTKNTTKISIIKFIQ